MNKRQFINSVLEVASTATLTSVLIAPVALRNLFFPIKPYYFETAGCRFLFLGGIHGQGGYFSQTLRIPSDTLLDACFLETGTLNYLDLGEKFPQLEHNLSREQIYSELYPYLRKSNTPRLYGDLPLTLVNAGVPDMVLSGVVGTVAALQVASRRELLQKIGWGLLASWGLGKVAVDGTLCAVPEVFRGEKTRHLREMGAFLQLSHPLDTLINLRGVVIAKKLLMYGEALKAKGVDEPTIGIAAGLGHELISESLRLGPQFCLDYLGLYHPFLEKAYGKKITEYLPSLWEVRNDNNQILVDQEIKRGVERG